MRLIITVIILCSTTHLFAQLGNTSIAELKLKTIPLGISETGKSTTPVCNIPWQCNGNCAIYTFTGSGNWSKESNWEGRLIPPVLLYRCFEIIINPRDDQECIMDIPVQNIPTGATLSVMPGKKFRVPVSVQIKTDE